MAESSTGGTRQRSFRLPETTLQALGARARERRESTNSLARRLIEEGLRTERHPLIWFREEAAGRRPAILGTRLDVWQVIEYLAANGQDVDEVAQILDIPAHWVRAAADYHAEYGTDVDAWASEQSAFAQHAEDAHRQRRSTTP